MLYSTCTQDCRHWLLGSQQSPISKKKKKNGSGGGGGDEDNDADNTTETLSYSTYTQLIAAGSKSGPFLPVMAF